MTTVTEWMYCCMMNISMDSCGFVVFIFFSFFLFILIPMMMLDVTILKIDVECPTFELFDPRFDWSGGMEIQMCKRTLTPPNALQSYVCFSILEQFCLLCWFFLLLYLFISLFVDCRCSTLLPFALLVMMI